MGAGVVGGAIAGWMWEPCVGAELADVINRASTDGPSTLALMVVYASGALLPALMLAALPAAVPRVRPVVDHAAVRGVGLLFGAGYALTVAIGRYDDVVGELVRRSTA